MRFKAELRPKRLAGILPMGLWYSAWWMMRVLLIILCIGSVIFTTALFLRARHAALAHHHPHPHHQHEQ
jgi:hypothetical protein